MNGEHESERVIDSEQRKWGRDERSTDNREIVGWRGKIGVVKGVS